MEVRLGGGELRLELIDEFLVARILRSLKLVAEILHELLGLGGGGDGILGRLDLVHELIDHHLGGVGGDDGVLPRLLGLGGGVVQVGDDIASLHLDNLQLSGGDGPLVSLVLVDRLLEFDGELEGAIGNRVDRGGSLLGRRVASSSFFSASQSPRRWSRSCELESFWRAASTSFWRFSYSSLMAWIFSFSSLSFGASPRTSRRLLGGGEVVDRLDENLRLLRLLDGSSAPLGGGHLALDSLDGLVRLPRLVSASAAAS